MIRVAPTTPGAFSENGQHYKRIEEIRTGDVVLAWNEESGELSYKRVVNTFIRETDQIYRLSFERGEEIQTTHSHPFYVIRNSGYGGSRTTQGEWVEAKHLRVGDRVQTAEGRTISITAIGIEARPETVYNFEVIDEHNYFVGRAGILVHNEGLEYRNSTLGRYWRVVSNRDISDREIIAAYGQEGVGNFRLGESLGALLYADVLVAAQFDPADPWISEEDAQRLADAANRAIEARFGPLDTLEPAFVEGLSEGLLTVFTADVRNSKLGIAFQYGLITTGGNSRRATGLNGPAARLSSARYVSQRIAELAESIPPQQRGRITMAVAVVEDSTGARRVLIGTSEGSGYLRRGVRNQIRRTDQVVPGTGHAEADIANYARQNNLRIVSIGATRPVCAGCAATIGTGGGEIVTPLKTPEVRGP
ncbi:MAG: hypothetical protein H7A22_15610 [Spirochaetales bacterium]|nr:hypothetical protein [Spirochaetales bacterium]